MKNYKKLAIAGSLCLVFLALAVGAPLGLRAASRIVLSGGAQIVYENSGEVTHPDDETLAEQKTQLESAGLVVSEDGTVALLNNTGSIGGSPAQVRTMREGLIQNGILSYCKYEGSVCTVMNELVAVLDFSRYYIQAFSENCLDGLKDAIFGNWSVSFDNVTVPVYDSVTGEPLAPVTASFSQGGYVIGGTRSTRYSLRIVLPNIGAEVFTFGENSLNFSNMGAPTNLAIDISNLALKRVDGKILGVDLHPYVFGAAAWQSGKPNHIHFIGYEDNQLEYAMSAALSQLSLIDLSVLGADLSIEIFAKQRPGEVFTQLAVGMTKTRSGGELTIRVYDTPRDELSADRDAVGILNLGHWFKYVYGEIPRATFEHVRRDSDNQVNTADTAVLTYDWEGVDQNGAVMHRAYCRHSGEGTTGAEIGWFSRGQLFYRPDGTQIIL